MKRWIALLALALVVIVPGLAVAQSSATTAGTAVMLVPNGAYPLVPYVTGTASDSGTINKQLTVTITPPAGQFVYVQGWDSTACQNATSTVMTNLTFTTTGFTNLPKINQFSLAATANICAAPIFLSLPWPGMKSSASGTAVTFVSPAAVAQAAFTLNVYAATGP